MFALTAPSQTGVPWDTSRWVPGFHYSSDLSIVRDTTTNLMEMSYFIRVYYSIPTVATFLARWTHLNKQPHTINEIKDPTNFTLLSRGMLSH